MKTRRSTDSAAAGPVLKFVAAGIAFCGLLHSALAQQSALTVAGSQAVVTVAEQAARDADRVRILQAELVQEQQRADDAARLKAQRLASGDAVAADEAQLAQARSLENVAALRRELAATPVPHQAVRSMPASGLTSQARGVPDSTPSWWDVYARPRSDSQSRAVAVTPARP